MKKLKKVAIAGLAVAFAISLSGPITVHAATTAPALGTAEDYSVYSDAGITNTGADTHVWGKVGDNNAGHDGLIADQVDSGIIDTTTETGTGIATDAFTTAYNYLNSGTQTPITSDFDLGGNNTVTPGVYLVGATTLNGTLTLNGAGVYIFRSDSSISVSDAGTMVLTGGACASDVFWQIPISMTISNAAHIEGTIIAKTGNITFADSASLKGRALAHTAITMINNIITEPVCAAVVYSSPRTGTINVVKTVINDNGGTKTVADFPLFVSGTPVVSGITNTFRAPAGVYAVTETADSNYTRTFSGDCDVNGELNLNGGDNKFCIITNNDIGASVVTPPVPPLIDVVKVPNPLALPGGPGSVEYTYTLRNIGTVPVTDVTMVGDTCRPIVLASGDTNADAKLDVTETWKYTCSTTLLETHTNTVVATGWANGLSATDIASAHVVVGLPIVPPLIHVTKIPSPLTLLAGGGTVTYTERITNPGTVALSNVRLTDDKCSPMKYISGDINSDSKLDVTEIWTYTCKTKLTTTTTNTAVATGEANGLTARDFAIATVVVAAVVPTLPNTGFPTGITLGSIIMLAGILTLISASLVLALKKSKV